MARLGEELATLVVDRRLWLLVAQQAVAGLQQGDSPVLPTPGTYLAFLSFSSRIDEIDPSQISHRRGLSLQQIALARMVWHKNVAVAQRVTPLAQTCTIGARSLHDQFREIAIYTTAV